MKEAIKKTYGRKGQNIVDMNCAAVDAGIDNVREVKVPAEWADAEGGLDRIEAVGRDKLHTDYINNILKPTNGMYGDDVPVSAFIDTVKRCGSIGNGSI